MKFITLEFYKPYLKNYDIIRKEINSSKLKSEILKLERKGYTVHILG